MKHRMAVEPSPSRMARTHESVTTECTPQTMLGSFGRSKFWKYVDPPSKQKTNYDADTSTVTVQVFDHAD
jgi:hypothetical protein